jgi:hypothetical protein
MQAGVDKLATVVGVTLGPKAHPLSTPAHILNALALHSLDKQHIRRTTSISLSHAMSL